MNVFNAPCLSTRTMLAYKYNSNVNVNVQFRFRFACLSPSMIDDRLTLRLGVHSLSNDDALRCPFLSIALSFPQYCDSVSPQRKKRSSLRALMTWHYTRLLHTGLKESTNDSKQWWKPCFDDSRLPRAPRGLIIGGKHLRLSH